MKCRECEATKKMPEYKKPERCPLCRKLCSKTDDLLMNDNQEEERRIRKEYKFDRLVIL